MVATPQPASGTDAYRFRYASLVDEHGEIPDGAIRRALRQRQRSLRAKTGSPLRDERLALDEWTFRGPSNIAGRTRSLLVHPERPHELLAGAVSGGLWRSTDGGGTWRPVDDFAPSLLVGSLARDPSRPDVLYLGTGEAFAWNRGSGIFRSTDGGRSWTLLPATAGFGPVTRIAVSPTDPARILAATTPGSSLLSSGGLLLSTDEGVSWRPVLGGASRTHAWDVELAADGSHAVAGIMKASQGDEHAAFVSTDGGETWVEGTGLFAGSQLSRRIELALAPSDGRIVYASDGTGAIWRSEDGGASYELRRSSGGFVQGSWNNALWVDPTDPEHLLFGHVYLFRSRDGGATLERVGTGYPGHADYHLIVPEPGFDGAGRRGIWVANDGGVYYTPDVYALAARTGWMDRNAGYASTQFYNGAGHAGSGLVVGGTQDNGNIRIERGSRQGENFTGGDGAGLAIDPDGVTYYVSTQYFNDLYRVTPDGHSDIGDRLPDRGPDRSGVGNFNFIPPMALDPSDPERLYVGGASLWRSDDAKSGQPPSWTEARLPLDNGRPIFINSLAVSPHDPDTVWVGHNSGAVYRTRDARAAAPTWEAVDDNEARDPLPNRAPLRIFVDRFAPETVWMTFGGFTDGNVQVTRDGGRTWSDATGSGATGLPFSPVRAIAQHPIEGWLYAGTEVGIFVSEDGGATWSTSNRGPANVVVDDLSFLQESEVLLAATHGRGLWTLDQGRDPADELRLLGGRFRVAATWENQFDGSSGGARPLPSTDLAGFFTFDDPRNVELMVKMLDFGDRILFFYGQLTNLRFEITVTDTLTGQMKRYRNGPNDCGAVDEDAFPGTGLAARGRSSSTTRFGGRPAPGLAGAQMALLPRARPTRDAALTNRAGACTPTPTRLCLLGGEVAAELSWENQFNGATGTGIAEQLSSLTGSFAFDDPDNLEVLVKALDFGDRILLLWGALSNLGYALDVTHVPTGRTKRYENPPGTYCGGLDEHAF